MPRHETKTKRTKTLRIAGVNVVSHPHSARRYLWMFKLAQELNLAANYFGNRWGIIGNFDRDPRGFFGSLHLYTNINVDRPWLNTKSGQQADENEVSRSVRIPANLKPEFTSVPFVFFPDRHKLLFEKIISPGAVATILQNIFRSKEVMHLCRLRDLDVHVIQDQGHIDELLALPNLRKIEITVMRPNSDDLAKQEQELEDRLSRINSKSVTETYIAKPQGLDPDKHIQDLARLSATNGHVRATYKNKSGVVETKSSTSVPLVHAERFSPEEATVLDRLFANGRRFF